MNKKLFVEKQLQRLVKAIDPGVQQLIYTTTAVSETVIVCRITGNKRVDVTADSLKAITIDVLRTL